jgi:OOP family OmpA-OmpF porin
MKGKKMKTITLTLVLFIFCSLSFSQDVASSKDPPMFNRMPGYRIINYKENEFNVYEDFLDEKGKKLSVEGHYYYIKYTLIKGEKEASGTQVLRNYENAVLNAGGSVVYEPKSCCNIYLKLTKNNRTTWVRVWSYPSASSYVVWLIESEEMKQDVVVDAKSMMDNINAQGRVALYGIYFDFDKSDVKPESEPTLKEISKLLSENPKLNLYVVGHTDNIGDYNYNMKLSGARADAVVNILISKYNVGKSRLTPAGVGPLAPVTTNDTEEGKAKNRRVELIKK